MGDFNLPVARWGDTLGSQSGDELYIILKSEFHQHVNSPTRDNNILDLVLSTCEDLVNDLKVGLEFSTSDHRLITFKVKMKNKVLNRNADFVKLRNLLAISDWSKILTARGINKSGEVFQVIFNGEVNNCVHIRNRRKQENKTKVVD